MKPRCHFPLSVDAVRAVVAAITIAIALSTTAAELPANLPFKPRTAVEGAKKFEAVPAEKSGLRHVPHVHNENPLSYMYHSGFVCGGVAVADIDGDGLPDLAFGGAAEKNRLYRGRGDFTFEELTDKIAGPLTDGSRWTTGVAAVDVNGDGRTDLYCCNYEAPNQLFLNQGADRNGVPAFREVAAAAGLGVVDSSHSAYFCDYDRDGDLDLFLLTNKVEDPRGHPGDERAPTEQIGNVVRIKAGEDRYYDVWKYDEKTAGSEAVGRPDVLFRNDGTGADGVPKFTDVTKQAGISGRGDGLSATWWDYDGDGWPDLYVGNDFLSEDRLWHNNRDGTFTEVLGDVAPHTCWFSMGADQGDLNNDLLPDFFIADMSATTHYKSKTTMGAMGGLNLKRAVASRPPQYMRNTCLIGTGAGRFLEAAYLLGVASTDWTWAVKFADLDLDGWQDIYVTNGIIRAMNHSDHEVNAQQVVNHHLWDFYKDRDPRPEKHRAYRNEHHLHFHEVSDDWGLGRTAITYACAYADFDRDGALDLIEVNLDEPPALYRNTTAGGHSVVFQMAGPPGNPSGYGTKIVVRTASGAQMRQLFPQSGYHSLNEAILHFGLGEAAAIPTVTVTWPNGAEQQLSELPADRLYTLSQPAGVTPKTAPPAQKATLFVKDAAFPSIRHQERPYDDFADQILLPHSLSQLGPAVAWSDVNGDGLSDVFIGGGAGQIPELRLADGKGGFASQWVDALRADKVCEDMGAVFFDADGDGDADLFVASGSYQFKRGDALLRDRLYLNDGAGAFEKAPEGAMPDFREASGPVAVADFDRDGRFDIYIGSRVAPGDYPSPPQSRLLHNESKKGSVKFADVTETVGPELRQSGLVSGAVWSDVNGDGWADLLLAHEWGTVTLFLNDHGRLALRPGATDDLATAAGWWLSVDTADLDGDGDLDIVAGNFGYNTKYKEATKEKPKLLYYADFDNTGRKNIVEVKREGDTLYPERGRSCSSTAMPFLKTKFPTYDLFAKASLDQVYGEKLKTADRFEANTLGTGIFWNEGNDARGVPKFRYEPLDRLAQVAPTFGIAIADFDANGLPDLLLAQNFFGPQIETGHYDGGLGQLLLNRGKGVFEPVPAGESGVVIPGDAKAASVADLNRDGWPDALVTCNAAAAEPLANRSGASAGIEKSPPLCVSLPSGAASGARIAWERPGRPTRIAEYHAGGGYLSQNEPCVWFGVEGGPPSGTVVVTWGDGAQSRHAVKGFTVAAAPKAKSK